jgi:hypothetical protein
MPSGTRFCTSRWSESGNTRIIRHARIHSDRGHAWFCSEKGHGWFCYAALFPCLTLAHLARWAAAILRRAEVDIVRLFGTSAMPLTFAQRALWAAAMLARPLADIFRRLVPLVPR